MLNLNNKFKNQKGISLITVLLFMLVATIAATAVFKWLNSTGKSSASRMLQTEAGQAAQAGLEATRSWMTYHAADVGALIKQFNDGEKAPINVTDILDKEKKSNFEVYLVGVDVSKQPYTLKFLSTGEVRGGSKQTLAAIYNVNGLYQVYTPTEKSVLKFSQSLFGNIGSLTGTGEYGSVIINGNLKGNVPTASNGLIVTGNFEIQSSNQVTNAGDIFILGDLSTPNGKLTVGNNLYVGGSTALSSNGLEVKGDAYFEGNVNMNAELTVHGNATINGILTVNMNGNGRLDIKGNLVLGPSGKIIYTGNNNAPWIYGNVWSPATIERSGTGEVNDDKRPQFGINEGTKLYAPSLSSDSKTLNNLSGYVDNENVYLWSRGYGGSPGANEEAPFAGGDPLTYMAEQINTTTNVVSDPLELANKTAWQGKVNPVCPDYPSYYSSLDNVAALNACYQYFKDKENTMLYEGFLVVEMTVDNTNNGNSTQLLGKFIFIVHAQNKQIKISPTGSNLSENMVLLYLPEGAGDILGTATGSNDVYNYFIFSEANVSNLQNFGSAKMNGTVFMANGSTLAKIQGGSSMEYNETLVNALVDAGIIQSTTGSTSEDTETVYGARDLYHIPLAPRLNITLQSQYNTAEPLPTGITPAPVNRSVLILPRIIYVPNNYAPGPLSAYYSVLPLNGATTAEKNGDPPSCTDGIQSKTTLASEDEPLTQGKVYTCTYTPASSLGQSAMYFWVVAGGKVGASPTLKFNNVTMPQNPAGDGTQCTNVELNLGDGAVTGIVSAIITVDLESGWTIQQLYPTAGTTISGEQNGANFTVANLTPNASTQAFKVCWTGGTVTTETSTTLQITTCTDCNTGNPSIMNLTLAGKVNIVRDGDISQSQTLTDAGVLNYPACPEENTPNAWVNVTSANCTDMSTTETNNKWSCDSPTDGSVATFSINPVISAACTTLIDHSMIGPSIGTYTFYSDIRLHPYDMHVNANKSKSVDIDGTAPHALDTTFTTNGTAHVFYGVPYTINVSTSGTERLSSATCTPANSTSICNKSGDKVNITPLAETTVDLKIVNLGEDCIERLDGFANWGYDCTGEVCAKICNTTDCSIVNSETGDENSDAGWVQFYYTKKKVVQNGSGIHLPDLTTSDNSMNRAILLKTNQGTVDGYMEATINIGDGKASPAFVFRAKEDASEYYSVWLYETSNSKYNAYLCNENYDGASNTSLPVTAGSTVNGCSIITLSPELPTSSFSSNSDFTFAIEFIGTSLTVTLTQGGTVYEGSAIIGRAESSAHNRFGFAFYKHANKSFLGSFAIASLEADGSCELTGGCDYSPSFCNGLYEDAMSVPIGVNIGNSYYNNLCYFVTSISKYQMNGGTINGLAAPSTNCGLYGNTCSDSDFPDKVDGGYYIYLNAYVNGLTGTAGAPECRVIGGGGTTTPTLSCGTVPPTGTVGTAITHPTVTCSDNSTASNLSWSNAPNWSSPIANTYNNISVTATCGSTSNLQADCDGILEVSAIPPKLSCGTVPSSGTVGFAITPPTVTCSDNSTPTITNWTNAPDWSNPTANTYSNISVTATCGSTSGLNADCDGSITVSSGTPNSCNFSQDWCPGIDWETGIKWGSNYSNIDKSCFFLKANGGSAPTCNGSDGCTINAGDGGYYAYMYGPNYGYGISNSGGAQTQPSCIAPVLPPPTLYCGDVTKTIANGATLAQIGNINDEVSCEYGDVPIITGWSFDSSLEGTYYNPIVTATCGNTQNLTANCSGSVTVNPAGGDPITVSGGTDLGNGTYLLTCETTGPELLCKYGSSPNNGSCNVTDYTVTVTVDGVTKYVTLSNCWDVGSATWSDVCDGNAHTVSISGVHSNLNFKCGYWF